MPSSIERQKLRIADQVWVAIALLHRLNPARTDFSTEEIVDKVASEGLAHTHQPGLKTHISSHLVANKPSHSAGGYRMLFETRYDRKRLFRDGDPAHESRGGKVLPYREDIPAQYQYLLEWYGAWSRASSVQREPVPPEQTALPKAGRFNGLLRLRGTWKSEESPDDFIRRMREDWD